MPPHRSAKQLPKTSIPGTSLCKHLSRVWCVRPLPLQRAGYTSATRCRSGSHNGVMQNLGREARKREGRHVKYSAGNFEGWSSIPFQARGGGEAPEDFMAQSSNEKSLTNPLSVVFSYQVKTFAQSWEKGGGMEHKRWWRWQSHIPTLVYGQTPLIPVLTVNPCKEHPFDIHLCSY